ncbi:hypothetical protein [Halorussus marinus]|uniref:hypothetical protein n=1 Tax=Halorussus marinus TaxID=2505976 RepID=UPI00106E8A86|nr:hypothetical protein [Halorussus marinus]
MNRFYYYYKLATVQLGSIPLSLVAPQHAARADVIGHIDALIPHSATHPQFHIDTATAEQEKQLKFLIEDLYHFANLEVEYTTADEADVEIEIRENWSCVVRGVVGGEKREWEHGVLPLPPIRDGEAPDEYHGFELEDLDSEGDGSC